MDVRGIGEPDVLVFVLVEFYFHLQNFLRSDTLQVVAHLQTLLVDVFFYLTILEERKVVFKVTKVVVYLLTSSLVVLFGYRCIELEIDRFPETFFGLEDGLEADYRLPVIFSGFVASSALLAHLL